MKRAVKVPDCLSHHKPLDGMDVDECEQIAFTGDCIEHRLIQRLLNEVQRLRHELADPQYQYAGGRIHRYAILCREASIAQQRDELVRLRDELKAIRQPASTA